MVAMKNNNKLLFSITLMLCVASPARASEIFTWTDEDGVVHFSDSRPADLDDVGTLTINDRNPPGYDPQEDPYSIRNQAKRINDTWTELEKAREEREEKRREEMARQPASQPYYDPYYRYWDFRHYPPVRPPRPLPRPGRTVVRQVRALDELNLAGQRPYSINSSAHHARVESSADFLSAVPAAGPRPRPLPR